MLIHTFTPMWVVVVALLQPAGHGSVGATLLRMSPICLGPAGLLEQVSVMVMVSARGEAQLYKDISSLCLFHVY